MLMCILGKAAGLKRARYIRTIVTYNTILLSCFSV